MSIQFESEVILNHAINSVIITPFQLTKKAMDKEKEMLIELGEQKIKIGTELIERLNAFTNVPGISRIQKKIKTEISSLQNVMKNIEPIYF